MKLHLPLSLRLSLALSVAVLAAAPSHAAMTIWNVSELNGSPTSADSFTVGNTGSGDPVLKYVALDTRKSWNAQWSVMFTAKGENLTGDLSLIGLALTSSSAPTTDEYIGVVEGAKMSGGDLIHTTWGAAESGRSSGIDFSTYSDVTFVISRGSDGKRSLTAYDSGNFNESIFSCTTNTPQNFDNFYLSGFVFGGIGTGLYKDTGIPPEFEASANNVSFETNGNVGSYGLTKVGFLSDSVANVINLAEYYYGDSPHNNLTWNGSVSGNWSDASWDNGTAENASFATFDSVTFATENARVTVDTSVMADAISVNANTTINLAERLSASSVTVADGKELTLSGAGTAVVGTLTGGTVNVTNGGTVTASSLTGITATVEGATDSASASTLELTGGTLGDSSGSVTVNGALTLSHDGTVNLEGNVTLGSIVNNLGTGGTPGYAFLGYYGKNPSLTITGATDLTVKGDGSATDMSKIGFDRRKIIISDNASLKTHGISLSSNNGNNAKVEVRGTLEMIGTSQNDMNYLIVGANGSVLSGSEDGTSTSNLYVHNQVDVQADAHGNKGTLKAGTLRIGNNDTTQTTNLGGTVNVTSLQLDKGTAVISGEVTAQKVTDSAADKTGVYEGTVEGKLTITGDGGEVSTGSTLSGKFTVVKQGTSTQNFKGSGNELFAGSLKAEEGVMNLASMDTGIRNLQEIVIRDNAALGLYSANIGGDGKATVSLEKLTANGGTLTANVVMGDTSELVLDGTLTLNGSLTLNSTALSGELLDGLREEGDMATLVSGLAWSSLTIGSGVSTLAATDEAGQWTTDGYYQFSSAKLEAAFGNLNPGAYEMRYYGTADGVDGSLVLAYVPEPTSATLSLLALAGLCARRRRR